MAARRRKKSKGLCERLEEKLPRVLGSLVLAMDFAPFVWVFLVKPLAVGG